MMPKVIIQGLMTLFAEGYRLIYTLFTCNHAHAPFTEGKSICPDCGRVVILQWAVLRCDQCKTKRNSRFIFRTVLPVENYCTLCGQHETTLEYMENPSYYKLHKAVLVVQDEQTYLNRQTLLWPEKTRVWLDSKLDSGTRTQSNALQQWAPAL